LVLGTPQHVLGSFRGKAAAIRDAEEGSPCIYISGKWMPRSRAFEQIARDRYGLAVVNTGCVSTPYLSAFREAYNEIALQKLSQRGIALDVESLWEEAELLAAQG
jgi:hypothetical protein